MIAYLDCAASGVSGDKFVGALIAAGFDERDLRRALAPVGLARAVKVVERDAGGVRALGIEVDCDGSLPLRTWPQVRDLIRAANAPEDVLERAQAIVAAIAEAEARVHGVPIEEVHFHEIGACDTIVDSIGAALGVHALGIETLVCSPVAVGSGEIHSSHGVLPVPAPATALLLEGVPVVAGAAAGELTTPTGAAIVRTLAASFGSLPAMRLAATGRGAGSRDLGTPNLVQVLVGEPLVSPSAPPGTEPVVLLETNVDHLSPEALAFACDRIFEAGALDVWQTPIVMKKGRAAYLLSALADPETAAALAAVIVRETGSLGVRIHPTERYTVWRSTVEMETSLGTARFKAWRAGDREGIRVEHDDAARIARETHLPLQAVVERLEQDARERGAREKKG